MSVTSPVGPPPKQLAHFEILRRLGVGGMAEVFLAKKRGAENTFKLLVLKRVLPAHSSSSRFRTMFAEEANLATRLNHPNIVQVYEFQDYGEEGQLLSMEYVEGLDLGRLMSGARHKSTRVAPWVGAYIVAEVAKGLHYAHERKDERGEPLGIVHRDVSPQNVLLSYEGGVKIADFGIATANMFRDEVGVLKGKFAYMSPEQARGEKVDRRSDIYSLGVILHEVLTGRPMRPGLAGDELLDAVRSGMVEPPSTFTPNVPVELDQIVMKALAADRSDRFANARELYSAIARAMLQRQEFVDAAAVESVVAQLVGREITSPGVEEQIEEAASEVPPDSLPAPIAPEAAPSMLTPAEAARRDSSPPKSRSMRPGARDRASLEVRHVAVLIVRLHGLPELHAASDVAAAARAEDEIRKMLDQLAFKRGARLTWTSPDQARAVVGLMANPTRAAFEACTLAVDVHEFLGNSSEDWPCSIQASVGIVRAVASGRRDKHGNLVEHELLAPAEFLASLVGDRAPRSSTWVAGGLYRLVRNEFLWEDAPTVEIEGAAERQLPRAMRINRLMRPLSREEREARLSGSMSDLIGRDAEKADLHSAFHQVTAARASGLSGRIITRAIVGEMGIGKTALVSAFKHELPPEVAKIQIDCSPSHSEVPMSSLAELVRALSGTSAEQTLEQAHAAIVETLGPNGQALGQVAFRLAELASGKSVEHFDDEDIGYVRKMFLTGIRALIGVIADRGPLLIIIEGLQWGDTPSLEMIRELIDTSEPVPMLVLLVTRPDERALPFIENIVRIELRGLRPDEQLRLVESRLGVHDGVAAVCTDLVPRVAGNPFFLLEMVDALLERGTLEIQERNGRQVLERVDAGNRAQPLPSTLEQLIGDRLNELPAEEREVAQWLAVAHGPLTVNDLTELGHLQSDDPIVRLCARGMCERRGDQVDFRYPIARDVAYNAIDPSERVHMHRELGQHLSNTPIATGLSAVIVARHLARGRSISLAADYYLEAAQAARTGYQTQLATHYYLRALSLLSKDDPRRLKAHEALEAIYRVLGRHRERRKHLIALRVLAKRSRSSHWVAIALTRTAVFLSDESQYARALPMCHRACAATHVARLPNLEVEALAVLSETLRELGDVQGSLGACDRALEVAKSSQVSPRVRADVLRSRGVLLRRVGRVREAVDCYAAAIAVFRRVGARRPEARARNALAYAMFVLERFEDSIACALASISIDLAIGGRFQLAKTLANIGQAYARLGDLPRGLAYLKRARDAHERYGDQDARADTLLVSAEVVLEEGDVESARNFCLDAAALIAAASSAYDEVHVKFVHALLDRASGNSASAVVRAADARQAAETQALVSFHFYATAIEAAARVDIGEIHTGILLATTALGAMAAVQGSEYGLETCCLCWNTLERAGALQAQEARKTAIGRALQIGDMIRDPRLKALFYKRPLVRNLLGPAAPTGPADGAKIAVLPKENA
ncbi:MAG: protein kinase [Deltaproteobacteria bacterium]|nr:protein kinase [Deltaproteobacteria bacterium]